MPFDSNTQGDSSYILMFFSYGTCVLSCARGSLHAGAAASVSLQRPSSRPDLSRVQPTGHLAFCAPPPVKPYRESKWPVAFVSGRVFLISWRRVVPNNTNRSTTIEYRCGLPTGNADKVTDGTILADLQSPLCMYSLASAMDFSKVGPTLPSPH